MRGRAVRAHGSPPPMVWVPKIRTGAARSLQPVACRCSQQLAARSLQPAAWSLQPAACSCSRMYFNYSLQPAYSSCNMYIPVMTRSNSKILRM